MKLEILLDLTALMVFSVGQVLHHEVVSGVLHSAINLTTSFDPLCMKDISWFHIIHGEEYRIMKVRHGVVVDRLNSKYQPFHNGTILGINNVTDGGLYIADVTFLNNTSKKEVFNVTLLGEEETDDHSTVSHTIIPFGTVLAVVFSVVVVVVAVLLWKHWKTLKHLCRCFITEDGSSY